MDQICDDLGAEHAAVDAIVCELDESSWAGPTPAADWDVKDTIVHLIQGDMAAHLAVTDPDEFASAKAAIGAGGFESAFGSAENKSGDDVVAWWRTERQKMLTAFRALDPKDRIPWFGPDMGALSFATARLMETWSHGSDVAAAVGKHLAPTDRLRHIAHIGVSTRGWSYVNRGMTPPADPVRVELTGPNGDGWYWGPEDAPSKVAGSAEEFCLLVTQRRHISEIDLAITGESASEWLAIAQAFAGPPTLPLPNRVDG